MQERGGGVAAWPPGGDLAVGVDIIEIDRVGQTLARFGARFLERVYTADEVAYCRGRAPQLAARFAAKEAVMKALGAGMRGIGWREVEVTRKRSGEPGIALHGRAAKRAERIGVTQLVVSLSHSRAYAVASVVGRRGVPATGQDERPRAEFA